MYRLKNISFSFGEKEVIKDLTLSLQPGTVQGILGDNGAGKTTLFQLLFGNLNPDSGEIGSGFKKQHMAYLETDIYFYPYMTGEEYLKLITRYRKADLTQWNSIFKLPLGDYASEYSTGMKKKLGLLGVLLLNKELLIPDEPFNGLDLQTCEVLHYIIKRLRDNGKTILLSSHVLETVISNADQISFLENGSIIKNYRPEEYCLLSGFIESRFRGNVAERIDGLLV